MNKRGLKIGTYDTARLWTLTAWEFAPAEQDTYYLAVPGRTKGPLDLSTALTDDEPTYGNRALTATFECSEGDRLQRKQWIAEMVNALDGRRWDIILPDDPHHYAVGRVRVKPLYNDPAHASVSVTAVCEPWLYNIFETVVVLQPTATTQVTALVNNGRMPLMPSVVVTGAGASALIECGAARYALGEGTYELPELFLRPGETAVKYSGTGTVSITYREAVLE
jgi:hypothetical protein